MFGNFNTNTNRNEGKCLKTVSRAFTGSSGIGAYSPCKAPLSVSNNTVPILFI